MHLYRRYCIGKRCKEREGDWQLGLKGLSIKGGPLSFEVAGPAARASICSG